MLSVIVDARDSQTELPALLVQLTAGAVDGLVRDLVILAAPTPLIAALCEETGAETVSEGLAAAAARARYDRLLLAPSGIRLKSNWIAALGDHLARGGEAGLLEGEGGGLFRRAPTAVLTTREAALAHTDLQGLRRGLGRGARRIG